MNIHFKWWFSLGSARRREWRATILSGNVPDYGDGIRNDDRVDSSEVKQTPTRVVSSKKENLLTERCSLKHQKLLEAQHLRMAGTYVQSKT